MKIQEDLLPPVILPTVAQDGRSYYDRVKISISTKQTHADITYHIYKYDDTPISIDNPYSEPFYVEYDPDNPNYTDGDGVTYYYIIVYAKCSRDGWADSAFASSYIKVRQKPIQSDNQIQTSVTNDFPVKEEMLGTSAGNDSFNTGTYNPRRWTGLPGFFGYGDSGNVSVPGIDPDTDKVILRNWGSGKAQGFSSQNIWGVSGDFSINMDFEFTYNHSDYTYQLNPYGKIAIGMGRPPYHFILMQLQYGSTSGLNDKYLMTYYDALGNEIDINPAASTDDSGKLKLTRAGNVFTGAYWNGASYTDIGTHTLSALDGEPIWVGFGLWTNEDKNIPNMGNMDNFVLTGGTIVMDGTIKGSI